MLKRYFAVLVLIALAMTAAPCAVASDDTIRLTDEAVGYIEASLNVPWRVDVTRIECGDVWYWEAGQMWLFDVELYSGTQFLAMASFNIDTFEMARNIYLYSPENVNQSELIWR